MSITICLIMAAIIVIAYWLGKKVGEADAYVICARAYKRNKAATCKAFEQLIEEFDL